MNAKQPPKSTPHASQLDRRSFLRRSAGMGAGLLVGGGLEVASPVAASAAPPTQPLGSGASSQPNILVICVDQLRQPRWYGVPGSQTPALPPNISRIANAGVSFASHYTASNDCTPSRAAMLTGLYTHQTGCFVTGQSTLSPEFPTWGTMLRDQGYATYWYGKWHLTSGDGSWDAATGPAALEDYDFAGGTFPSPDGAPAQGWHIDPVVATQFEQWYANYAAEGPWCTTLSFVNPHDITWWFKQTDHAPEEATAPRTTHGLPPNFETPDQLWAGNKPDLQLALIETSGRAFGEVGYTAKALEHWQTFPDLYIKLQLAVDVQIGKVLDTLASQPEVAANTVVIFTSDHGEYCASHGMRGKGGGVYEEGINVPLIVNDLRGKLHNGAGSVRNQLTSSVDIAPLLLTLGYGGSGWRSESRYAHIASRLDIAELLVNPSAPGRDYILHATDELTAEFALERYDPSMPIQVTAIRTPSAKLAVYSQWQPGTTVPLSLGEQVELYDYTTASGRLEIDNVAGTSASEEPLREVLEAAVADELAAPLPSNLIAAQQEGFADYAAVEAKAAARLQQLEAASLDALTLPATPTKKHHHPARHRHPSKRKN